MSSINGGSFSLQDALDMQQGGRSTPSNADELAEAEAAMAELRQDQRRRENETSKTAVIASQVVDLMDSSSSGSDDNAALVVHPPPPNTSQQQQQRKNNRSPPPPPPPTNASQQQQQQQRNRSNTNTIRKPTKQVIMLKGTLQPLTTTENGVNVIKSMIRGHWNMVNEKGTFELVSNGPSLPNSEGPTSGLYSGFFMMTYKKLTAMGKLSTKQEKIDEKNVKLEFRKPANPQQPNWSYRVEGFGTNDFANDFFLSGKATPLGSGKYQRNYEIVLRKTYQDLSAPLIASTIAKQKTISTNPSSLSTLPRPQQQKTPPPPPPVRRPSPPPPPPVRRPTPPPLPDLTKSKKNSPEARTDRGTDSLSDIQNTYRRNPDKQDIPGTNKQPTAHPPTTPQPPRPPSQITMSQSPNGVDRVNGKGMWHAWTRSFDTPLLALLDLFDNAVDASWTLLPKKHQQHRNLPKPKIRVDLDRWGRNGVVMRNASTFIPPLQQVLQVYKSSKAGEGDNSIGENGIGVKHACASLSGLSFVFTKTTDPRDGTCTLSMGILMQELQRDDGIVLPSVAFPVGVSRNGSLDEVYEKLEKHCAENPETWGKAVKEYGDDHFGDGIDRCVRHMDYLRRDQNWRDSDNVFAVVLVSLKHAAFNDDGETEEEDNEIIKVNAKSGNSSFSYHMVRRGGDTDVDEDEQRSLSLLKNLRGNLPHLYLHLHDLDIWVDNKPIESIYWERRLAELSRFDLQLSQTDLWSKPSRIRSNTNNNDVMSVFNISNPEETVRFFVGFDPRRCFKGGSSSSNDSSDDDVITSLAPGVGGEVMNQMNNAAMKVYLYSRQSGRLIKVKNDPRNEYRLSSGSTDFCQGLTVIIDDHNGTLPLNPTKQDTAYGHSKHGQIHAANLKEWTAAITSFYWTHHKERFGSSKKAMTDAVAKTKPSLDAAYKNYRNDQEVYGSENTEWHESTITPLCKGKFISYPGTEFHLANYTGQPRIRANKFARSNAVPVVDQQSVIARLDEEAAKIAIRDSEARKRSLPNSSGLIVSEHGGSLEVASTPANKRPRTFLQHNQMEPQDGRSFTQNGAGWTNNPQLEQAINALREDNQKLKESLVRNRNRVTEAKEIIANSSNEVSTLKNEVDRCRQDRARYEEEIHLLKRERDQQREYHQKQIQETLRWKEEANRLRQQPGTPPPSPYSSQTSASTPSRGELTELDKLRREVKIYRSRAEFYKKETESKKKQIEDLTQEKSRFEERIQELEDSQLSFSHGGYAEDAMQF